MQILNTERLILRPWREDDAEALFRYASDPDVGNAAGWPPHTSVDMSRQVIRDYFSAPEIYALVLRDTGEPIGCCGLVPPGERPNDRFGSDDAEIGYWIGKPYWGQGLIPEAVKALAGHAFGELGRAALWIGCNDVNRKSRRVAEKCGFRFDHVRTMDEANELFYVLRAVPDVTFRKAGGLSPDMMPLLMMGDESETMISRYISRSALFEGMSGERRVAVCAVVDGGSDGVEIMNLAVEPSFRGCGIGRRMLSYVESCYPGQTFRLGTGETPSTLRFYESCGYTYSHRIPGFFVDNYPDTIIEEGVRLNDMICLVKHTQ